MNQAASSELARPAANHFDSLVEDYAEASAKLGGFDEFLDGAGRIRHQWAPFVTGLSALSRAEMKTRSANLHRRVLETGIAFDEFADPNSASQPWRLDLMPLCFSQSDWKRLESGLKQRAALFDAILGDIYGPQELIRSGLIPNELVFSDWAYLRPCIGKLPPKGELRFYAADIARDAQGNWRVIDNHTETLAGIGFALANRVVQSQISADLFKSANAVRLADYFQSVLNELLEKTGRPNPRIALLSPGPSHPDYFSHAYIARYFGLVLVEGSDLRTVGGQVFLKTLEGLKQVDLILRCVDGHLADPLELDPSGFAGPPGLMRAIRQKPGVMINALGSAAAENPGLGCYLDNICQNLFGQRLMLPDSARLWLGDSRHRDQVLADLNAYVIRSAQEGTGRPGQAAPGRDSTSLSPAEREKLEHDIALLGAQMVAEPRHSFSTAPSYENGRLVPRPVALRVYCARVGDGYQVMPGGVAVTVDTPHATGLSSTNPHTRDIWVIGDEAQPSHQSLWRPTVAAARVQRSHRATQSRVADDLFWLGRYGERMDWTLRVMRGSLKRVVDDAGPVVGPAASYLSLTALLRDTEDQAIEAPTGIGDSDIERLVDQLIGGGSGWRNLLETTAGLYRVANHARDRLSLEAWQTLNAFRPGGDWIRGCSHPSTPARLDALNSGLQAIAAFGGLMHENMTRNHGWTFLDMGRRLERAYNLSEAMLALFLPRPDKQEETDRLMFLLEVADSFITYRSRYRLDPELTLVLDLLLLDSSNPRSISFQLDKISAHFDALPGNGLKGGRDISEQRRLLIEMWSSIQLCELEEIASPEGEERLRTLLEKHRSLLPQLSDALSRRYFNLVDETPHRVHTRVAPA